MFVPHYGQCPKCAVGTRGLIATKRGLCQKHLHEFKQEGKVERKGVSIALMKKQGYVTQAINMAEDWAKRADMLFSEYIRRRNVDQYGRTRCVTCGDKKHWRQMTCGHYVKRRHLGTRFYDKNCDVQCYTCQTDIETNKSLEKTFEAHLIKLYGPGIVRELEIRKNATVKISEAEYKDMCEELTLKIANL